MPDSTSKPNGERITVQGVDTYYVRAGEGDRTVVLIHAGGLDHGTFTWRDAIAPLAERFRVLVPDLPGFGETATPDVRYTIDYYGTFVRDFLRALNVERAHFVGLSMGGGVALNVALRYPELVDRLVPVGSYGLSHEIRKPWLTWAFTRVPPAHRYFYKQAFQSREKILRHFTPAAPGMTREMADEMYTMYRRPGAGRAFRNLNRNDVTPRGLRTDYSNRVGEIQAPTLFLHGDKDSMVPFARGERAAARMRNAVARSVPGAGHFLPRERPDTFNSIVLDFLLGVGENAEQHAS